MTADITILGLGPGPTGWRTVAAQQALDSANRIFIRNHAGTDFSDLLARPNVTDIHQHRDQAAPSGQRWKSSAEAVVNAAAEGPVVLAIPGHPRFGEMLTVETIAMAGTHGLTVEVIDGISAIDMLASALDIDPIHDRVQMIAGWHLMAIEKQNPFAGGLLNLSPHLPILITHVYSNEFLAAAASQLLRIFPADHHVELINAAGLETETRVGATVGELATAAGGPLLAICVPALGALNATRTPDTLQHIVARLRRDDGCPWDRKQTHASLAQSLADEVYEVIDAIDAGDDANLAEELGDLLLLIMMHAQIAEERGAFRLEDVYDSINAKIVRRHPHVFGDLSAANAEEVVGLWQQVKSQEKKNAPNKPEKAADGEPHSMPALLRAARVLKKHPPAVTDSTVESRQQALIDAIAAIVVAGDDPEQILKTALTNHVANAERGSGQGEIDASH